VKILLVTPMPPSSRAAGAIPVLLHAELVGLRQRHEVTVLTVAGPRETELEALALLQASGVELYAVRRSTPQPLTRWHRRARLTTSWLRSRWPRRTVWFYEPEIQRLIDRLAASRDFDVIAVEDNSMGVYRYPRNIPAVLTEHEVRRPRRIDWRRVAATAGRAAVAELDWQRWRDYQAAVWSKFALVQVFTQRDADAVFDIAPNLQGKVRVNPYGVELPGEIDGASEEGNTILFVGNFRHVPNVDAAVWLGRTIVPLVRSRIPDVRITLVGLNAPREVRALAAPGVELLGAVDDMRPLLARTAVVLAPIRIGGGMRMKVLHAMAHGKAVVTTPRGAEGLALGREALPLILAEDGRALADATVALLQDDERRHSLGRAARDFVTAHFGPEAHAERLEAVYTELVAEPEIATRVDG
jgi:glycosyltransferase involved in cell wall biosynthesis